MPPSGPNQVIALSLGFTMPEPDRARRALAVIERDLLTPFGLRTLAPSDPQYRPTCDGSAYQRDSSYHQGTVWPWLMGPFITAYVRTHGDEGRAKASTWLAGFADHLRDAGLGSISEIFDAGAAPRAPRLHRPGLERLRNPSHACRRHPPVEQAFSPALACPLLWGSLLSCGPVANRARRRKAAVRPRA